MNYLIIIIIIIILYMIQLSIGEKFGHASNFPRPYINKCKCKNQCINSRCVYKSLFECQNNCKKGCQFCGDYTWRCELQ
jgi:hypothetical protein